MAKFATNSEIESCTACVMVDEAVKLLKEEGSREAILEDPILEDLFHEFVPAGGTVVGSMRKGTVQVLDTDSHDVIVASSGRKKTRAEILPSIISFALNGSPMVVNDMKGEILSASYGLLEAMGYNVLVSTTVTPSLPRAPTTCSPWHGAASTRATATLPQRSSAT